jgi:enhancing lycopene biosynthesis protein 2
MNHRRIGVLLSGSGVHDGSEIHEAVLTLLALDRRGAEAVCMAPDVDQIDVIDHLTVRRSQQKRNVLTESARIARGRISPIREIEPVDLDGLVIPGGFGAAKNLCTYAADGRKCRVDPDVRRLLLALHEQKKPIAALCIAPVILASVFGKKHRPQVTAGKDLDIMNDLGAMGARPQAAESTQISVDRENRLVTTPAYMGTERLAEVAVGIEKAVEAVLAMAPEPELAV